MFARAERMGNAQRTGGREMLLFRMADTSERASESETVFMFFLLAAFASTLRVGRIESNQKPREWAMNGMEW